MATNIEPVEWQYNSVLCIQRLPGGFGRRMRFCRITNCLILVGLVLSNNLPLALAAESAPAIKSAPVKEKASKEAAISTVTKPVRPNFVEKYLFVDKLQEGEEAINAQLKKKPKDDQLRFGLAVVQFLQAVEHLTKSFYKYGMRNNAAEGMNLPFLRLPVGGNPNPEVFGYTNARSIFEVLYGKLGQVEATLAGITDPKVKLSLHFGLIRLDVDGNGLCEQDEVLWKLFADLTHNYEMKLEKAEQFSITFDRGDVHWLQGYCHLLMSLCQVYLAHNSKEFFECTAHMFFQKVDSPYPFLNSGKHVHALRGSDLDVVDLIALIHLIRWDVAEPERMASALHHLEGMVVKSKEMWKSVIAETDDDHEWIPNPLQTGIIPNVHVTNEMISAWLDLMDKSEQVLQGKLLIAFWRGGDGRGVNLRRVFTEPTKLDLVMWVQGPSAAPYLEEGPTTKMETWRNLQNAFGREFPGFAVWFN